MIGREWQPYVGIPYEREDCWALIRRYYREQHSIELPELEPFRSAGQVCSLIAQESAHWVRIDPGSERVGDVLTFWIRDPRVPSHVAVVVEPRRLMLGSRHPRSRIESYAELFWRTRLHAIFRSPRSIDERGAGGGLDLPHALRA